MVNFGLTTLQKSLVRKVIHGNLQVDNAVTEQYTLVLINHFAR